MPKKNIDYSKTSIYKIVCKDVNITDCYVGSTTDFVKRKSSHKRVCSNPNDKGYTYYVYSFIRNNGGWENWDMVQIETYNATNKQDQHTRERFYIEQLKATLNKVIPTRTAEEYEFMRKEDPIRKEYAKQKSKTFYDENKELVLTKMKEYHKQNKDVISEKRSQIILCECGCESNSRHIARHRKSAKHINRMLIHPA